MAELKRIEEDLPTAELASYDIPPRGQTRFRMQAGDPDMKMRGLMLADHTHCFLACT
jgi:hypothetical protein